jgi:hypothetical protein
MGFLAEITIGHVIYHVLRELYLQIPSEELNRLAFSLPQYMTHYITRIILGFYLAYPSTPRDYYVASQLWQTSIVPFPFQHVIQENIVDRFRSYSAPCHIKGKHYADIIIVMRDFNFSN